MSPCCSLSLLAYENNTPNSLLCIFKQLPLRTGEIFHPLCNSSAQRLSFSWEILIYYCLGPSGVLLISMTAFWLE